MKNVQNILPLFCFFFFLIWQETQKDQEWKEMRPTLYLLRREEKPSVGLALLQKGELPPPPFPNQEGKETSLQTSTGFPEHSIKNELSNIFSYPNTQAFRCGKSGSTVRKFKAYLAVWFWMWLLLKEYCILEGTHHFFFSPGAVMSHLHNLIL